MATPAAEENVKNMDAPDAPAEGPDQSDPAYRYFNRDLSWLDFNQRVLHEAQDPRNALLDRVKFLAIFSSNTDEFFMKRVGLLKRKIADLSTERSVDGLSCQQQLQTIRKRLSALIALQVAVWHGQLRPALEAQQIFVRNYHDLTEPQQRSANAYFRRQIFPVLTPLAVDPDHPFPFISNLSMSLGVLLRGPASPELLFARVKVPGLFSRWYTFLEQNRAVFVPLESLIAGQLELLFPGMQVMECRPFRITRNAEVEAETEDTEDLLEVVQEELRARRFADTVRVQTPHEMSQAMRSYLVDGMEITPEDLYDLPEPLGMGDFMAITELNRPRLKGHSWTPVTPAALVDHETDIFAAIRKGDILVQHPYESFDASVERFILSAVEDPRVLAIKMTLYRTSGDSPFVAALARAAESGKQVAVLVELKARFDEESNIQWAQALERAGAHVVYGVMGLKTHTKTALVVRREEPAVRCYCHVATGNYNSKTARLYTDLGLLTCREDICEDVVELFAFLTGRSLKRSYQKLLVAPVTMRRQFLDFINTEAHNAREGRPARIIAKMNALEDPQVIEALYAAGRAGVKIDLIVRGFCCLRPGVPGLSPNIGVSCVIGEFLEHSRIFYFLNGGAERFYIGSADWMSRNLNNRVEAAVPVEDPALRARLREILDIILADNRQAWDLHSDGVWVQRQPAPDEAPRGTQFEMMRRIAMINEQRSTMLDH